MRENRRTELRFDARLASAGQRHSVTARVLGVVERIIGLHQPGGGGWHAGIQHGQPDADGELDGAPIVNDLMLGDRLAQPFGNQPGGLAVGIQQQDPELLSPP